MTLPLKFIKMTIKTLIFSLITPLMITSLNGAPSNPKTLYSKIDPLSITQHLALYEIYPDTPEGKKALQKACELLTQRNSSDLKAPIQIPSTAINALIDLINKHPDTATPTLSENELQTIETLANHLPNRFLKGHSVTSIEALIQLPTEEIDLARGLFLSQLGEGAESLQQIRSYEATIDLMALQILAKLPAKATSADKIRIINHLIFHEMGFRFPPHSQYAKDIDLYTFLPSVLDSRQGVCLGVSILYLSLAQRLKLPLEAITPPGHIYVRSREGDSVINIETTARGIHIDSEDYLGLDTRSLHLRDIKEVIGLAHINQASLFWKEQQYDKALACYEKAAPFVPNDKMISELAAWNYVFTGHIDKGKKLLESLRGYIPDYAITSGTIIDDFLDGKVDVDGVKTVFLSVDETRESILKKRDALELTVKKFPEFREGWLNLGITWLQLHRTKEALAILEKYHTLHKNDPSAEYYLAAISAQRFYYDRAWEHLRHAEKITSERNHHPKALKMLRQQLGSIAPE